MAITRTVMVALWCLTAVGIGLIGSRRRPLSNPVSVRLGPSAPVPCPRWSRCRQHRGLLRRWSVVDRGSSTCPSCRPRTASGRKVTFPLVGEQSFTYDVRTGRGAFSGALLLDKTVAQR